MFFGGSKGGVGKSTTSHLACLGAVLCNQAAAYVLTDPDRKIRDKGRPYDVLDGMDPKQLAQILKASQTTSDGWLIIDGAVSEHRGKRIERDIKTHRSRIADVPRLVLKELEPRAIHSGKLGRVLRPQRRLLGHDACGAFPTASVRFDHDHVVTRHRIDIDRP